MYKTFLKSACIVVNQYTQYPISFDKEVLKEYDVFILIDEDLDKMNEFALFLEENDKTVYIIREISELQHFFESESIVFAKNRISVYTIK